MNIACNKQSSEHSLRHYLLVLAFGLWLMKSFKFFPLTHIFRKLLTLRLLNISTLTVRDYAIKMSQYIAWRVLPYSFPYIFVQFVISLKIQDHQDCQFVKYLISEGLCSQQDDSANIATPEPSTMSKRINVNSFSELCVSACTEEEVCTCQEIGKCYIYMYLYTCTCQGSHYNSKSKWFVSVVTLMETLPIG